jgi:hypothetical protein
MSIGRTAKSEDFPTEALFARKVGTLVNNSRNEDPRCVQEADS